MIVCRRKQTQALLAHAELADEDGAAPGISENQTLNLSPTPFNLCGLP